MPLLWNTALGTLRYRPKSDFYLHLEDVFFVAVFCADAFVFDFDVVALVV